MLYEERGRFVFRHRAVGEQLIYTSHYNIACIRFPGVGTTDPVSVEPVIECYRNLERKTRSPPTPVGGSRD